MNNFPEYIDKDEHNQRPAEKNERRLFMNSFHRERKVAFPEIVVFETEMVSLTCRLN